MITIQQAPFEIKHNLNEIRNSESSSNKETREIEFQHGGFKLKHVDLFGPMQAVAKDIILRGTVVIMQSVTRSGILRIRQKKSKTLRDQAIATIQQLAKACLAIDSKTTKAIIEVKELAKKEARRIKRLRQKAKKKALALATSSAAISEPSIKTPKQAFLTSSSKAFRKSVLNKCLASNKFNAAQKEFMQLIYDSNLPMNIEYLQIFKSPFYKLLIAHARHELKDNRLSEIFDERDYLLTEEIQPLFALIQSELNASAIIIGENISVLIPKLRAAIKNITLQLIAASNLAPLNVKKYDQVAHKGEQHLFSWSEGIQEEVEKYNRMLKVSGLRLRKTKAITGKMLSDLFIKIESFPMLTAYSILMHALSLKIGGIGTYEPRIQILADDLEDNALYPSILKEDIIPQIMEQGITAFATNWEENIYNSPPTSTLSKSLLKKINAPEPFHHQLIDHMITSKIPAQVYLPKIEATINEAYEARAISPWSRVIYVHAVITQIAAKDPNFEETVSRAEGASREEKMLSYFRQNLDTLDYDDFNKVLLPGAIEKLPETDSTINFTLVRYTMLTVNGVPLDAAFDKIQDLFLNTIASLQRLLQLSERIKKEIR